MEPSFQTSTIQYPNTHIHNIITYTGFNIQFAMNDKNVTDVKGENGFLKGVKKDGKRVVWKDDLMYAPDRGWYNINMLECVRVNNGFRVYRGLTMLRSNSSLMLLPLIGGDRDDFSYSEYLMNAFCFHEAFAKNRLWVLMRKPIKKDPKYEYTLGLFRESPYLEREEFIGSEFAMFTFRIPDVFEDDYMLFMQSKYSRMSERAKQRILEFHGISDQNNRLKLQLYRDKRLRDSMEKQLSNPAIPGVCKESSVVIDPEAELRSVLDRERETFKLEYIIDECRATIAANFRTDNDTGVRDGLVSSPS